MFHKQSVEHENPAKILTTLTVYFCTFYIWNLYIFYYLILFYYYLFDRDSVNIVYLKKKKKKKRERVLVRTVINVYFLMHPPAERQCI